MQNKVILAGIICTNILLGVLGGIIVFDRQEQHEINTRFVKLYEQDATFDGKILKENLLPFRRRTTETFDDLTYNQGVMQNDLAKIKSKLIQLEQRVDDLHKSVNGKRGVVGDKAVGNAPIELMD
jgi:uncharacterized protein (DUF2164 family)